MDDTHQGCSKVVHLPDNHQHLHGVVTDDDKVKACEDLKAAYPEVAWKEGKLLNRATKKELEDWINKQ